MLYLLHGIAGNHDEWRGYIRADTILDNVIAESKAVPMIVVMPNGRALYHDHHAHRMYDVRLFRRLQRLNLTG